MCPSVFTTARLVQFCVSKSPPFNVTSLIAVQLACNSTEVVNVLHPELIRRLPINRFVLVTQSECHVNISTYYTLIQYILRFLTLLTSSRNFSNIPTLLKQFHSSGFLPIARHYSMTLCTDIRSCRRGFTMIQFCLVYHQIVLPSLIKTAFILLRHYT